MPPTDPDRAPAGEPASVTDLAAPGRTEHRPPTEEDLATIHRQLGRVPRGVVSIAHRCPCGCPDVVRTEPRLPDGTPFPTSFYATCPRLTGAISTLESEGMMREMTERLATDPELAASYAAAHQDYLARRAELGSVPEIEGISAGGMPTRVKCLHVLVAHSLAVGPGVNPLGDEALAALPQWWLDGCCDPDDDAVDDPGDDVTDLGDDAGESTEGADVETDLTGPSR